LAALSQGVRCCHQYLCCLALLVERAQDANLQQVVWDQVPLAALAQVQQVLLSPILF